MKLLLVMAAIVFISVIGEMGPASTIVQMSNDLHVDLGHVGFLISAFSFSVVLTAAPLTALTRKIPRRRMMTAVLVILGLGHAATALTPGYEVALVIRFVTGAAHGLFWMLVGSIVGRVCEHDKLTRAMSIVLGGGTLAFVVGTPASNYISTVFGWRPVMLAAGIGFILLAPLFRLTLKDPLLMPERSEASTLKEIIFSRWMPACVLTLLVVLAHFTLSSYIPAYLEDIYKVAPEMVSVLMMLYGLGGVVGNLLAGSVFSSRPQVGMAAAVLISLTGILVLGVTNGLLGMSAYVFWGIAFGMVPIFLTVFLLQRVNDHNRDIANAFYTLAFNAGIGGGALLGGLLLGGFGLLILPAAAALGFLISLFMTIRITFVRRATK